MINSTALVRWETTPNKDLIVLNGLKKLSIEETCSRKQKSTDCYNPPSGKNITSTEQCHHNGSAPEGHIENVFYWEKNSFKFCAEGAIQNLMNILHCSKHDKDRFWNIVTSPVHLIPQALGESSVPKAVVKFVSNMILFKKACGSFAKNLKFTTTRGLQINFFQNLQQAIDILRMMRFPLVISVKGTHASCHHVVDTWRGMIIVYESKYTFPLTNGSLRQICGVSTSFDGISCGYGIFPPPYIVTPLTTSLLEVWNKMNIASKTVPLRV